MVWEVQTGCFFYCQDEVKKKVELEFDFGMKLCGSVVFIWSPNGLIWSLFGKMLRALKRPNLAIIAEVEIWHASQVLGHFLVHFRFFAHLSAELHFLAQKFMLLALSSHKAVCTRKSSFELVTILINYWDVNKSWRNGCFLCTGWRKYRDRLKGGG